MPDARQRKADYTPEAWAAKVERNRRYRERNRNAINARRREAWQPRPRRPGEPEVPVPGAPSGHAWYEEADALLQTIERAELESNMDSGVHDILQEYVLAKLEARDPIAAIEAFRREWRIRLRMEVHALALVDDLRR